MDALDSPLFTVPKLNSLAKSDIAIEVNDLALYFGQRKVLHEISMRIPKNKVTAIIGPSGCGKSTLIGCFNRLNDLHQDCRIEGQVIIGERNIFHHKQNVPELRTKVGMVFQRPNPFPVSVYENVVYGLRIKGISDRRLLDNVVENALIKAALWDEVKDNLFDSALLLSTGQQQRLVIARALALEPEILILDEPTSALDPISTLLIEELINDLRSQFTVIIVTHNLQQAARVSDYTAFLHQGELIEYSDTDTIFTLPAQQQTEAYITGRYG
ncbi:phosphate ABC transporter ATP-binding protein PstB [Alteromonas sp. a30]|uniref:phosphate ABC transporter ATP-binding protein PstB n=1 Tax=Alteromonas sp. a30 TaxID=2730917 RepID=UPI00227F15FD|nr:phosphate ABC transporter ATP-binding protein PstB [Alteromonas sp. a30]MCY7296028.1 phosphate ABC transporter ATP-binding protein [Alteromonas sp. a30]